MTRLRVSDYRHVEQLLRFYYHQLAGKAQLAEDELTHTRERIDDLRRLVEHTLPSIGVANYATESTGRGGEHSDMTARLALWSHPELRRHQRDLSGLYEWETIVLGEQRELETIRVTIAGAVQELAGSDPDAVALLEAYYRDRHSYTAIAEMRYCSESTLRRRLMRILADWSPFFSYHLSEKSLPNCVNYLPEIRQKTAPETPGIGRFAVV